MNRLTSGVGLAAALTLGAAADIPPPVPENPLPAACQPFIGMWSRTEPKISRGVRTWEIIAIGSEYATVLNYWNHDGVYMMSDAMTFALDCTAAANGGVLLAFTNDAEASFALTVTPAGETSFTTREEAAYLEAGPPVEGWTPEIRTITWTRIAR